MRPYKSLFSENKRSLREGFNLRPFTRQDHMVWPDLRQPVSGENMMGVIDLYIDKEDQNTINRLKNSIFQNPVVAAMPSKDFFQTEDGDWVIPQCDVLVYATGVYIVGASGTDGTISIVLHYSNTFENALKMVKSKFFKSMYLSDLKRLGFKLRIDEENLFDF